MTVKGGPEAPETKTVPKHKKNADVGTKQTVFSSQIIIEQEDAKTFAENEEVSLSSLPRMFQPPINSLDHTDGLGKCHHPHHQEVT